MVDQEIREHIKLACYLFNRPKAVAITAGVDDSNFGKWLRGKPTLSDSNVARILETLGLPDLNPDTSRIHTWLISSPPKGNMSNMDLPQALKLYFPNGAQIAKSPWCNKGLERIIGLFKNRPSATYAITDGKTKAVLRVTFPMLLQKKNIKRPIFWRDGTEEKSILNISETQKHWVSGTPSQEQFDEVWNDKSVPSTLEDIISTIRELGISYEEAIRRIRKG